MAFILKDRVKESTTTTGTGAISLGGSSATFDAFQTYMSNGDTTYYSLAHTTAGTDEWEVGIGTWNTGNTLTRTTVLAGSNGTSAVDLSAGTKDIFMTYPAAKALFKDASGNLTVGGNLTVTGSTTTLSSTNSVVTDKLIELANGTSGSASGDSGIIIERGSDANAFIGFDESENKFKLGTGTFTGASSGDLSITTGTLISNLEADSVIVGGSNGVTLGQGSVSIKNNGTQSYVDFYCEAANAHYARLQAPAHAAFGGNITLTLPATTDTLVGRTTTDTLTNKTLTTPVITSISNSGTITIPSGNDTLVGRATTDTLTNKTLTSAVLNTGVSGTAILDEDNMASDSATQLATQQSIKAYVDSEVTNASVSTEAVQDIVGAMFSSNTETNISATYEDGDGTIDLVVNSLPNSALANSSVSFGGVSLALGATDATPAFDLQDATGYPTSSLTGTITNTQLAGSIANAKLANSTITVSDGSNSTATALGGTITFAATSNETTVAESSGTITIGLPNDVTVSNDLTVSGNLVVSGSTTQTGAIITDNNFTGLTNANTGNATDFGFYGKYVESSTTKYAGLYYDASTDNTFRLFCDTQTVPASTVNTSATGYADANLVVGGISNSSGDFTLDVVGDIKLDADGGDIRLLDGGTQFGKFTRSSGDFIISSSENDKDIKFAGADGGSDITALTLDMSEAGAATFNAGITVNGNIANSSGDLTIDAAGDIILDADGGDVFFNDAGTTWARFQNNAGDLLIESKIDDKDMIFRGVDGGSIVTALTLDMSEAGAATFNAGASFNGGIIDLGGTSNTGFIDFDGSSLQLNTQRNPNTGSFANTGRAHQSIVLSDGNGTASNGYIRFMNASSNNSTASESGRFNSAGDLLLGTTDNLPSSNNVEGIALSTGTYSGYLSVSRTGEVVDINRKGSNGALIVLRKDGSNYGKIGVNGDDNLNILSTAADHAGLEFATHLIAPLEAGSSSNGTISLGASSNRFKDGYFGGSGYFSGLVSGSQLVATSDLAKKENLEVVDDALSKVQTLTGYTYDMKKDGSRKAGLIAQDVEKVLPEAVDGDEGEKTLDYNATIALLVNAIKEQQTQIDQLKEQLNGNN